MDMNMEWNEMKWNENTWKYQWQGDMSLEVSWTHEIHLVDQIEAVRASSDTNASKSDAWHETHMGSTSMYSKETKLRRALRLWDTRAEAPPQTTVAWIAEKLLWSFPQEESND